MAKAVNKKGKNRRLKRSIRKTLGALFLASALAVAAIPTEGLRAADDITAYAYTGPTITEKVFEGTDAIPRVDENATIYTYPMEGTGVSFRFAYVSPESGREDATIRVAVILGYTQIGNLEGGTLRIPDTMEAYMKYDLTGTDTGSVAVNMNKQFLYYKRTIEVYQRGTGTPGERLDSEGYVLDATGHRIVVNTYDEYYPCYYATRATWVNDTVFYEAVGNAVSGNQPANYQISTADRIASATVAYIGNQYLEEEPNTGIWKIKGDITNASQGIFYNQTNITNLEMGKDLMGVGNYAFANCGLRKVTFGNGLRRMGNSAFADCGNLSEVNFDLSCAVPVIGDHCFSNCVSLRSIDLPGNVQSLGNSAFEGCINLENVNLVHEAEEYMGSLQEVGQSVFKGCALLKNLVVPHTYSGDMDVSIFEGCSSLSYIKTNGNSSFQLTAGADTGFGFKEFKETVLKAFYLEGPKSARLHNVATAQRIAYKFHDPDLNMDVYELIVGEDGKEGILYWVNEEGRIVRCEMEHGGQMKEVVLPEVIGPKNIVGVDSGTFQNKCFLETVTIPASVTYIAENAFKGSHNLKYVIFTDAANVQSIGAGAFATQEATGHLEGCPVGNGSEQLQTEANLNFVGTISNSCRPFTYAMTPSEYINTASQYRTYITYYSGWPTNLVVKYNEKTDLNELIDYPTFAELQSGRYKKSNGYAYMTEELETAAANAVDHYLNGGMTDYEREIIDATLNLVLPDGIESIATVNEKGEHVEDAASVGEGDAGTGFMGLFTYKEHQDILNSRARKTLTAHGLQVIYPGSFRNCDTLTSVEFNGPLKSVGNYAFDDCDILTGVSISESVNELGLRPFTNCRNLSDVDFNGSQKFTCDNSIIFETDGSGNKTKLVEYLYGRRSGSVKAEDLGGITEIYPEAFMHTGVKTIDLSQTGVTDIPVNAFRETAELFSVTLPGTCKSISQDSFTDSSIYELTIPRSVAVISNDAFRNINKDAPYTNITDTKSGSLIFYCADDSVAAIYADKYNPPIDHEPVKEPFYYKVVFFDWDGKVLETLDKVEEGTEAKPSVTPSREGYIFTGWVPPVDCVTENITTTAQYQVIDPDTLKVTVRFLDWNDAVLKEVRIAKGESAEPPRDPVREGYYFTGWRNSFQNVTEDVDVYAQYEKVDSTDTQHMVRFLDWDESVLSIQRVDHGGDAIIPRDPVREGYTFTRWLPSPTNVTKDLDVYATYTNGSGGSDPNNPGTSPSPGPGTDPSPSPNPNDPNNPNSGSGNGSSSSNGSNTKFYTLTVKNGSGSGSYVAGAQPIVIANDPSSNQEFSHWTIDPENTTIASKVLSATVITMPEGNVTVTAHYRARTASSNGSGNTSSANSSSNRRPNNSGTVSNGGGTTVVIDKNGISNTGVVAATVNGSSDNFVIKITENSEATEAVVRALMTEYGNLDNIKYFPMDISLYDSTGTNKITDTTGLSVSITLPIPDSLITYAGNNKVAGVVNDRLDKLSAKFTTISGVSCITFTAEHFSPYVIYVDTANLSAGGSADATPKTGDGIHPKWFLSVGLACLSFVMFMQKDKRKPQKVKVKAKA